MSEAPVRNDVRYCEDCPDDLTAVKGVIERSVSQFGEVYGVSVFSADSAEPIIGGSIHPYGEISYAAAVGHYLHKAVPEAYLLVVGASRPISPGSQMRIAMWHLSPGGVKPLSWSDARVAYMKSNRLKPMDRQMQKYMFVNAASVAS